MKPYIGIILDHEPPGGYSKFPWYALRENYFTCFEKTNAVCLGLPHDCNHMDTFLGLIHGLVIAGGNFDVSPELYGDSNVHERVTIKTGRTKFEMDMTQKALARDMPVLGICGGHQLLNVALGGTLIQHIPDEIETDLNHEQPTPRNQAYHTIDIKPGSKLQALVGRETMTVNSAHHQAVKELGRDLVVNAVASDGVIEGIESTAHTFCMGLQWHPEFLIDPADQIIFQGFARIAQTYQQSKP